VNGPIGASPAFRIAAQAPSSPLNAVSNAAATEGAQRANSPSPPGLTLPREHHPVSIAESANSLAREHVESYNAKLMVFKAFCDSFEETAKQFTSGPERSFAQRFSKRFLEFWNQALSDTKSGSLLPDPGLLPGTMLPHTNINNSQTHVARDNQYPPPRPEKTSVSSYDWKPKLGPETTSAMQSGPTSPQSSGSAWTRSRRQSQSTPDGLSGRPT
jgi:hypothetical protein